MTSSSVAVLKVLAGLASLTVILSPSIALRRIVRTKSVGVASVFPFIAVLANSHVWMMYGYMIGNYYPMFGTFAAGDIIAIVYLVIYWRFTNDKRHMLKLLVPAIVVLLLLSTYAILAGIGFTGQSCKQASSSVGIICDIVAVCLYGAPFERLAHVLKYKSAVFIQLPMVIAGTINNVLWALYALLIGNWYILAPNLAFMVIGLCSMILYVIYNPKTHPLLLHAESELVLDITEDGSLTPMEQFERMSTSELMSPSTVRVSASAVVWPREKV